MTSGSAATAVTIHTRGLLFDMDGILVSSLGSVERSWSKWAAGRSIDAASTVRMAHGRRAIDTLRELLPDADHFAELKAIEDFEVADTSDLRVLDGVMALLQALPRDRWTIVTSATDRLARARLAHAGVPVPERIVTGEMVTLGKPSAEPYRKGAEILGLAPEDCVVVEDSVSGVRAGLASGCRVLATTFSHSAEELAAATWIVKSLADLAVTVLDDRRRLVLELAAGALQPRLAV